MDSVKQHESPAVCRTYCNQVQMVASPWDIVFYFSEIEHVFEHSATKVSTSMVLRSIVTMSPGHARAFLQALVSTIDQHDAAASAPQGSVQ